MNKELAINLLRGSVLGTNEQLHEAVFMAIKALKADTKEIFYDGYAHCLMDFGKDTVRCKDCKHYKQSAVADRKMCFRKDVDGVEVCYDFLPYDSCTYGERKDGGENE